MPQSKNTKDKSSIRSIIIRNPSHRYIEVSEFLDSPNYSRRKATPKNFSDIQKLVVSIYRGIPKDEEVSEDLIQVERALLLDNIPSCRALLRGFIISGESYGVIATVIGDSPEVVATYSHLFFDTTVFYNILLQVSYIRDLPSSTEDEKFEKQVLSWGHYLGSKYIAWKIGAKGSASLLPSQAVRKVLDDSIWRSSEHALEEITSPKAKESKAWVPQVLKSAELLNNLETTAGMENALSELKIKLSGDAHVSTINTKDMEIKG